MSLAVRLTFNFLILLMSAAFLTGCTTASQKLEKRLKEGEPVARVFYGRYDEIESALKQAMLKYPQRIDNTEAGIFETDYVKGASRFQPPHTNVDYSSGYRYRILVRLVRGKSTARPAVKVLVTKQIEIVRDFFSQPETLPSDGLEENVILYRIGRELTMNRAFQKATARENNQQ